MAAVRDIRPDLVISDITLVRGQAKQISSLLDTCNDTPCLLITLNYQYIGDMFDLLQLGITEYLLKPFQFDEMIEWVEMMLASNP